MRETERENQGIPEIDLQKLFMAYLQRWWVILLCGVLAAAISLAYTVKNVTPLYRTSVTIYVNSYRVDPQSDSVPVNNLSTAARLVSTYSNMIKSNTVLERVIEKADLDCSAGALRGMISAEQVGETEIFNVYVANADPEMAAKVANAVAAIAPAAIEEFVTGSSTKIIDYAKVPQAPYTPNYTNSIVKGGAVGVVLAVAALTLVYLLDVRIKNEDDLSQLFDYPVLGQIPAFEQSSKKRGSYYENSQNNSGKSGGKKEGKDDVSKQKSAKRAR